MFIFISRLEKRTTGLMTAELFMRRQLKNVKILRFFGLIMLMYRSGFFKWFFSIFRPVGQMAFTNYRMQSLIGALFFYGIGLNYFGKLERYEIYI
jgi:uncharacterized protein